MHRLDRKIIIRPHPRCPVENKFKTKSIIEKLNIEPLKQQTINFLNWFSEYNLVPLGMALKLHLLSGKAIEKQKDIEYQKYQIEIKKEQFNLSEEQEKALKELRDPLQVSKDRGITMKELFN